QPRNIVVTVRVDSPGDDGGVTQTNVTVAGSDASNDSSTSQSGAVGAGGAAPGQDASTDQDASSTATATQDGAANIVVIVRIDSPGDDTISQTNTSAAGSSASNTSTTDQTVPAGGSGNASGNRGTPNDSSRDVPAASGPPAAQQWK